MKSKLKSTLIILAIIVLCLSVGVYAGYTLTATDVTYTKPGGTTPISVKEALDELHAEKKLSETEKTIGEEVTLGGEQFYVLRWEKSSSYATLISKYILNKEGTAQNSEGVTVCEFSSYIYWANSFTQAPFNLNNLGGYSSTDAMGKAKSYGSNKGALEARLLTYEEALAYQANAKSNSATKKVFYGWGSSSRGNFNYWLGTAVSTRDINNVYYVNGSTQSVTMTGNDFVGPGGIGVRPVIKILKSKAL